MEKQHIIQQYIMGPDGQAIKNRPETHSCGGENNNRQDREKRRFIYRKRPIKQSNPSLQTELAAHADTSAQIALNYI